MLKDPNKSMIENDETDIEKEGKTQIPTLNNCMEVQLLQLSDH